MLTLKNNKVYYTVVALIYFLVFRDYAEKINVPVVQYIDELIALLGVFIILILAVQRHKIKTQKSNVAMAVLLFIFVFFGMMGWLVYGYQTLLVTLVGMFLSIKFWLSLVTYGYLVRFLDVPKYANRLYRHLLVCACVLFGAQIVDLIFDIFPGEIRYGLKSCQLFYTHPMMVAVVTAFLIAFIFALYPYTHKGFFLCSGLLLLMGWTMRSKAIAMVACFIGMYAFFIILKGKLNFAVIAAGCAAMIAIAWNQITFYYSAARINTFARSALVAHGFTIASDHFPWGGGFGTFGSTTSATYYSPIYELYGLSNIQGLGQGANGGFICDTFWPMMYVESGLIGCVAYIGVIVLLYFQINKLRKKNVYVYMSALFVLVYLLVESTAAAAFSHPTASAMSFIFALTLYSNAAGKKQVKIPAIEDADMGGKRE